MPTRSGAAVGSHLHDAQDRSTLQAQGGPDLGGVDLASTLKAVTIKEWVAKGSYLPQKVEIDATFTLDGTALGIGQSSMTEQIKSTASYRNFNQPLSIVLPPEALAATELSTLS